MWTTWRALREAFPVMGWLEAHVDVFRAEALALPDDAGFRMPGVQYRGDWRAFPVLLDQYGEDFPPDAAALARRLCPQTHALLAARGDVVVGGFMRLEAGGEVPLHVDHRQDDVLRFHLALQLPEDEQAWWPLGWARPMDLRVPHGAKNPSDRWRLQLTVDVRMKEPIPTGSVPAWGVPIPDGTPPVLG
ncbi:MAG: lipid hydroxylase LpxO [Pseudomonadota bacterium]|jgi:aspartyl/asparaginyl beta-hydroxylase (cupin superfamily)